MSRIQSFGGRPWPVVTAATAVVLCLLSLLPSAAMARDADFCSTFNAGASDGQKSMSIFMSVGLCYDTCKANYAYAVINYQSCWCTNYEAAESTKVDISECSKSCPGYPDEFCGGDNNRFGYVALGNEPSGTRGASEPTSTNNSPTSDLGHAGSSPTPIITSVVVTGGLTVTSVLPAPTQSEGVNEGANEGANKAPTSSGSNSGGLSTGSVVGIIIGTLGSLAIMAVVLVCWFIQRRKRAEAAESGDSHRSSTAGIAAASDMGESSVGAGVSPSRWRHSVGPAGTVGSRLSEVDPRMDPFKGGLYVARSQSHETIHTILDEHDYSRRVHQPKILRATNPDPNLEE